METFLATVCTPDWNREQDAGRSWAVAVAELARRHPEQRAMIAAYWERWPETLGDAIEPTVELLDELRRRDVALFALSNWSAETFPLARPRYPFLDWFDGLVISGEEGVAKPDPRIYEVLLARYGLDPRSVLFVDDVAANVATAGALGMRTIRFTDAAALRRELVALGILG
jgi:2-haloacid dehalogenase